MCGYVHMSKMPTEAKDGIRSSGVEAIGSCELPKIRAGNRAELLCKCSMYS